MGRGASQKLAEFDYATLSLQVEQRDQVPVLSRRQQSNFGFQANAALSWTSRLFRKIILINFFVN